MPGNMFNIPHVLSADSPEGLRTLMLDNNILYKTEYVYYQIVHDGKRFHAFYMKSADEGSIPLKKKPKNVAKG